MSGDQAVVVHSPEHVAIHLIAAGFGRRFAAFLIDLLLIIGLTSLISMVTRLLPAYADASAARDPKDWVDGDPTSVPEPAL